jgi:hypothetical protein
VTWQEDRVVYRDIAFDSLRLIVDHKDVTRFRGVPTLLGGWQLQRPFGYGPATFAFPQVTDLEPLEEGDLWWLRREAPVRLIPVTDGVRGEDLWRGFIRIIESNEDGTLEITCEGDASGKLSARIKPPTMFERTDEAGRLVFGALKTCGVKLHPRLGPVTGIERSTRGGGGTYLDHVQALLSSLGDDWTIDPVWVNGRHKYEMVEVDTTTVHATIFWGTEGIKGRLGDDLFERPNTIFGTGTTPEGMKFINARAPGMFQGDPAPFPGLLQYGDTGDAVTVLQNRLLAVGPLELEDVVGPGGYDDATVEAVEWVKEEAGIPGDGTTVDEATWNAAFDLSVTGLSLFPGFVLPFWQASRVREWNRTATGAYASRNEGHDPDAIQVDALHDHEVARKRRVRAWSKRVGQRNEAGDNLVGSIDFDGADLFVGDITHATADKVILPATKLRAGMNIRVRGYQGRNPIVTCVGANVDGDLKVRAAVDSKARPLKTVGQIIQANKDTRFSPRRDFIQSVRGGPAAIRTQIIWSELGGRLGYKAQLTGGQWNRLEIVMGQTGEVSKTRIQTLDVPTRFVFGVFALDTAAEMLNARASNPTLASSNWHKASFQKEMREDRLLLHAIGQHKQMAGYHPGQQTTDDLVKREDVSEAEWNDLLADRWTGRDDDNMEALYPPDDPVTGLHVDTMSWPYQTFKDPACYLLIWVEDDCVIEPGRIFWHLESEGA